MSFSKKNKFKKVLINGCLKLKKNNNKKQPPQIHENISKMLSTSSFIKFILN